MGPEAGSGAGIRSRALESGFQVLSLFMSSQGFLSTFIILGATSLRFSRHPSLPGQQL